MIKRILVAHGGAKWSDPAFEFALDVAKKYKARVTVLSVARVPAVPDEEETEALIEGEQKRLKGAHERLHQKAQSARIKLERHIAVGHPAEQIIDYADSHKIDLIVLGHHTRSKLGKWLLGGTADKVMDHARCPVIVVKGKG